MSRPGSLALVLHTHMPYVESYGTWPFGEEWLWEAIATSYLPLLDVLDAAPGRVTLSVTPVLADQLEAPGALARCEAFLREIRPESHRRDIASATDPRIAAALEASAAQYAAAAANVAGVFDRLMTHATWTSAATHPILPLLATSSGVRLQLASGIAAHRTRRPRDDWSGGLWLPECAHVPWLDPLLEEAGVRLTCVELTDVFGEGAPEQLIPLRSGAGPLLVPIDREIIDLVWGLDGYPSSGAYRDSYHMTEHRHRPWAVDGTPYDGRRASRRARTDAADFVTRVKHRVMGGGLCVCALDTELLGHWWHEGVIWLEAVLERADAAGLPIVVLETAVDGLEARPAPPLPVSTWGTPRDLSTWSGRGARGLAWRQRRAELELSREARPSVRALRELLAAQASDWAFLLTRELAGEYPVERVDGHLAGLAAALAGPREPGVEHLAPHLVAAAFTGA
ncbi:MAG: DUF1957 domain-containing protein [Solirubrobacterales bacterium]|nr:DUF1957 domain-containing protein [Solirubrobacterales bacterium]